MEKGREKHGGAFTSLHFTACSSEILLCEAPQLQDNQRTGDTDRKLDDLRVCISESKATCLCQLRNLLDGSSRCTLVQAKLDEMAGILKDRQDVTIIDKCLKSQELNQFVKGVKGRRELLFGAVDFGGSTVRGDAATWNIVPMC